MHVVTCGSCGRSVIVTRESRCPECREPLALTSDESAMAEPGHEGTHEDDLQSDTELHGVEEQATDGLAGLTRGETVPVPDADIRSRHCELDEQVPGNDAVAGELIENESPEDQADEGGTDEESEDQISGGADQFDSLRLRREVVEPQRRGLFHLLFMPTGRIGRGAFIGGCLLVACYTCCGALVTDITSSLSEDDISTAGWVALGVSLFPLLPLGAKRAHDLDLSGAVVLLSPLCGAVPLAFLAAVIGGNSGANRFGPPTRLRWGPVTLVLIGLSFAAGAYGFQLNRDLHEWGVRFGMAIDWDAEGEDRACAETCEELYNDAIRLQRRKGFPRLFVPRALIAANWCGDSWLKLGEYERAVEWFRRAEKVIEQDGEFVHPIDYEGMVEFNAAGIRECLGNLGDVEAFTEMTEALAEDLGRRVEAGEATPDELDAFIAACVDLGRFDQAEEVLDGLIERTAARVQTNFRNQYLRSELARHHFNRAVARRGVSDDAGALEDAARAVELQTIVFQAHSSPRDATASLAAYQLMLGTMYLRVGRIAEARDQLELAVERAPLETDYRFTAAAAAAQMLDYESVIRLLETSLHLSEHVGAEYMLGVALLKHDRDDAAAAVVDRLGQRHGACVQFEFLKGTLHLRRREFSAAVQLLDSAAQRDANPSVLYNLALAHALAGDTDVAGLTARRLWLIDRPLADTVERHIASMSPDDVTLPLILELQ